MVNRLNYKGKIIENINYSQKEKNEKEEREKERERLRLEIKRNYYLKPVKICLMN